MSARGSWAKLLFHNKVRSVLPAVSLSVTKILANLRRVPPVKVNRRQQIQDPPCSSAITNTSDGPAGMSMLAPLIIWLTWRLASVTKALPGRKILSTFATTLRPPTPWLPPLAHRPPHKWFARYTGWQHKEFHPQGGGEHSTIFLQPAIFAGMALTSP